MNTGDAILAAIRDKPDDDTPRLAYADWLDDAAGDTPDPEAARLRAEFIRVQVAFARLGQVDRTCPFIREYARPDPGPSPLERWRWGVCRCRGCELTRREAELYATSAGWMLPTLPDAVDGVVIEQHEFDMGVGFVGLLRRGFVDAVTCPADDWLAHAADILAAHPVRRVRLTTRPDIESSHNPLTRSVVVWLRGRTKGLQVWEAELMNAGSETEVRRLGDDILLRLLDLEWPGVAFDLPPGPVVAGLRGDRREPMAFAERVVGTLGDRVRLADGREGELLGPVGADGFALVQVIPPD